MAGGIVADYKIIKTGPVVLKVGGDIDKTFEFVLPKATEPEAAILSFLLLGSNDLQLRIDINGDTVSDRLHSPGGVDRCIQQVVGPVLKDGKNEITFTTVKGEVRFSNVILWFQRQATFSGSSWGGRIAQELANSGVRLDRELTGS